MWWPGNWHADYWHGGQLACGKLAWRTIGIDFFNSFLFNYFNVLTNNKFHFQINNLWTMLPYKKSYFRMTYENKFCYRIIYRIIFESIVFTYYINPLLPSVLNIGRLSKILISTKEGIIKKISYERRAYESVDD